MKENAFKDAEIENSSSQLEYENLTNLEIPVDRISDSLKDRSVELLKMKFAESNEYKITELEVNLNTIDVEWERMRDSVKYLRLNFARENPNSFVSPYAVKPYFSRLPMDTLKSYYDSFSPKVQNSTIGQEIASYLDTASLLDTAGINKAPNFEELDINGNEISLKNFRGKYVLLDFWAGWCKPCIELHPGLKEVFKNYHSKGLEIVGISADKDKESWMKAIEKNQLDLWHQVYSGFSRSKNTIICKYNIPAIPAIPAYVLIDKEGIIIGRYLNAAGENDDLNSLSDLENKLKEIFNH